MVRDIKIDKGQITGILSPLLEMWRLNKVRNHIVGDCILDFGCGYGKLAKEIPGMYYIGVDIDEGVLESAKKLNTNIKGAYFYNVNQSEWRSHKFDTIILAAVIEHFDNPKTLLIYLTKFLNSNGRIIITTPTPNAGIVLTIGSKLGLFSREALEEHKSLLNESYFVDLSDTIGLMLEKYETFEFGLNQLIIYKNLGGRYLQDSDNSANS
ncbi:MAG: Methyltransferase type 11 [Methanothrix harundinacea]|uniref:Methyltransferase type 11 n=1 Tax=Methanothrix harundinacea TaxID=301375 RepID=A0A101IGI3_9EURY|nr:MAG: Methyltransferase type 11 [Methanothrix harundinacea]